MKPGGTLVVFDFSCGQEDPSLWTEQTLQNVEQKDSNLGFMQQYEKVSS